MKKLLSVLLAIAIMLCLSVLPVSAENIEDKDDSRLDMGEIFGYSYDVTFVDGEAETTAEFEENAKITYPTLAGIHGSDRVWSMSESEYSPVPENMPGEDITVYAYTIPYVGFENYPVVEYANDSRVIDVSSDYYFNGNNSLKYINLQYSAVSIEPDAWATNYNNYYTYNSGEYVKNAFEEAPEFEVGVYYALRNNEREHSVALGKATANTAYKISFKYYVPEALNASYYVTPYTGHSNLWGSGSNETGKRVDYTASKFTVNKSTETGKWLDGTIYFTADQKAIGSYTNIYLWLTASAVNNGDVVYFDNFVTEEVVSVSFNVIDGVEIGDYTGTLSNNVLTAYFEIGEEITAPNVTTKDGTPVVWVDENGNIATEFVAGGVYSIKLDSKGDLNVDGAVDTIDLAMLKRYIVESIDDTQINVTNADINSDTNIDIVDMAYLKLYLAGIIEI